MLQMIFFSYLVVVVSQLVVKDKRKKGVLTWNCGSGHGCVWESSDVLVQKERGQKVYVNTVMLAASILLSGNNFSKHHCGVDV